VEVGEGACAPVPHAPPLVCLRVHLEGLGAVVDVGQVKVDDVVAWGPGWGRGRVGNRALGRRRWAGGCSGGGCGSQAACCRAGAARGTEDAPAPVIAG
jgi:hypothetical protein